MAEHAERVEHAESSKKMNKKLILVVAIAPPAHYGYDFIFGSLSIGFFSIMTSFLFMAFACFTQYIMCEAATVGNTTINESLCSTEHYVKIMGTSLAVLTLLDSLEMIIILSLLMGIAKNKLFLMSDWLIITSFWILMYCATGIFYILVKTNPTWSMAISILSMLLALCVVSMITVLHFRELLRRTHKHIHHFKSSFKVEVTNVEKEDNVNSYNVDKKEDPPAIETV